MIIGIVGLGYVGIQLANAFANKNQNVIGFDINQYKIQQYKKGIDITNTIINISNNIKFTYNEQDLSNVDVYIVCVPTPVDEDKHANLTLVINATKTITKYLMPNNIVIYESTVAPYTTRNICIPLLEQSSLICNKDFWVGFSPERLAPNDTVITEITKLISGSNNIALQKIKDIYSIILPNKLHECSSLEVAEMSKLLENIKRDVNIALMNQFLMLCSDKNIDFYDVLQSAETKFNFINSKFSPGLVGGHCISVDPYYLLDTYSYTNDIIYEARQINEHFVDYITKKISNIAKNKNVTICGFSFKENCNDIRNTKVFDLYNQLLNICSNVNIYDNNCNNNEVLQMYNINLITNIPNNTEVIILATKDKQFLNIDLTPYIVIDIKNLLSENNATNVNWNNVYILGKNI